MAKFRKKPVVIDAEQYIARRLGMGRVPEGVCFGGPACETSEVHSAAHLHTMHQGQIVILEDGDWIIPEPDGVHYYPCKPDVFAATYEPAVES